MSAAVSATLTTPQQEDLRAYDMKGAVISTAPITREEKKKGEEFLCFGDGLVSLVGCKLLVSHS